MQFKATETIKFKDVSANLPACANIRWGVCLLLIFAMALGGLTGCGTRKPKGASRDFFTSGSREADERASQTMARQEQLTGEGEGSGEKGLKKAKVKSSSAKDKNSPGEVKNSPAGVKNSPEAMATGGTNKAAQATGKMSLFDRLGGESGISNIVADFLPRAMKDPRINWERVNVKRGGFSLTRNKPVEWKATPDNVGRLHEHMVQFLCLATGGPAQYDGKEMKSTHAGMHIDNAQFDSAIGDLKASLDKLQIPNKEQKELLAIVESTRPEIVEKR